MMRWAIYCMVYLGAALMVVNIYHYIRYAQRAQKMKNWGNERRILYVPIILLVLFLLGYLAIGLIGRPDLIVAGILFGGSVFVFIMFLLMQRITDRIQANERLEAKLMAAEESSRLKANFLSTVSHEMRTPMNAIIGINTLALRNQDLPEETRGQLNKIGVSAHHLLNLIDNIIDMSDIESGSLVLKSEPFSLREALEPVNMIIQAQCDVKGLSYSEKIDDGADLFVGDAMKLQEMLLSILDNAVKFTPQGGAVTFTMNELERDGNRRKLRFTVADTGIGMDAEYLPKLFQPFSQEDAGITSRYGGTGLGLAIAKRVASMMDGDITVVSEKNRGSTFTVTVTLTESDQAPVPVVETPAPQEEEPLAELAGRRVMIVEDMDINAELLADLLDLQDIVSERAENGQIAVEMFEKSAPFYYDAIMMDLRMPVMDGLDSARAIRALERPDAASVPIIAQTANALEADKLSVLKAGMNVHLSKPVDADVLYETLGRLIAAREKSADMKGSRA